MRKRNRERSPRKLDEAAARERCLRLLSVRARSTSELRERLARAGFERAVVDPVLIGLSEAGLVDDEEFARSWIAGRASVGIGRRRLRAELARKGIERNVMERLLAEQVGDEAERGRLEMLARKRLGRAGMDAPTLGRVRRFLIGRGYGFGMVDDVLRVVAGDADGS